MSDNGGIYVVFYHNSISDYGQIGAMIVQYGTLELISISCRVISKVVEKQMIDHMKNNYSFIEIDYTSMRKNKIFYDWVKGGIIMSIYSP